MTSAAATPQDSFKTLADINSALDILGLPKLGRSEASAIHAQGLRNTIVTLIQRSMRRDEGALAALTEQVKSLHRPAHEAPAPAAPHAEPRTRPAPQGTTTPPARREAPQPPPAQPPRHEGDARPTTAIEEREFASEHVYGGSAALCFDAGLSRVSEVNPRRGGKPTVFMQGAKSIGTRRYDWPNKITLQLTSAELVTVLAVFYGYVESCKFSNHGPANDKGFEIINQPHKGGIFVKLFGGKGHMVAVPVQAADAARVAALILRQACEHYGLDQSTMLNTVVRVYARLSPTPNPGQPT